MQEKVLSLRLYSILHSYAYVLQNGLKLSLEQIRAVVNVLKKYKCIRQGLAVIYPNEVDDVHLQGQVRISQMFSNPYKVCPDVQYQLST